MSVSGDLWGLTPNLDSWQQILHPRCEKKNNNNNNYIHSTPTPARTLASCPRYLVAVVPYRTRAVGLRSLPTDCADRSALSPTLRSLPTGPPLRPSVRLCPRVRRGNPILALADTRWLRDRSIFAISAGGALWELTQNAVWRHHRSPRNEHGHTILLAPVSGIVAPLQGSKQIYLLLLAADGSGLVERGWTGERFWWRFHPAPPGVTLAGPLTLMFVPGKAASREIHAAVVVLTLNGTALEFNTWAAHQPSLRGRMSPADFWAALVRFRSLPRRTALPRQPRTRLLTHPACCFFALAGRSWGEHTRACGWDRP